MLPLVEKALGAESDPAIREALSQVAATLQLRSDDKATRLAAVKRLGNSSQPAVKTLLLPLADKSEPDEDVRIAAQTSLRSIQARLARGEFAALAFSGVSLGSILLLAALGLAITYGLMGVINMAHGELMMLGAYGLYSTASLFSGHPLGAIAAAALLAIVLGGLVYFLLMRHMTGEMVLAAVLTTIALGILLRGVTVLVWGAQEQHPLYVLGWHNVSLPVGGSARISAVGLALVLTTAAVYGGLWAFLRHTRWGIRMRAVGQNPLLAAQRGIGLHGIYALAWSLATFTGGLAGMLIASDSALDQGMVVIGLKAFPAALVGGLDSLLGTLGGALIVATAEVLLIHYVNPLLSDVVPFVVLLATLIARPWGLRGTREELDRV
jgi:branched-chain amino acid transport system permease protein